MVSSDIFFVFLNLLMLLDIFIKTDSGYQVLLLVALDRKSEVTTNS